MRLSSSSLPQLTAHFSGGTRLVLCSGPPPEPRRAVWALLKTCNQLMVMASSLPKGYQKKCAGCAVYGVRNVSSERPVDSDPLAIHARHYSGWPLAYAYRWSRRPDEPDRCRIAL